MRRLLVILSVLILGFALNGNAQKHDVFTFENNTLYRGINHLWVITYEPTFNPCVSLTWRVVKGGILFEEKTDGYAKIYATSLGSYEIYYLARFRDGSTITATWKGEVKYKPNSGGSDGPVVIEPNPDFPYPLN